MTKAPKPPPDWTTLSAFSVSRATIDKLDAWLEEQNEGRRGPKLTRNALIRGLLDWAGDTRPDWEGRAASPEPIAPVAAPVQKVPSRPKKVAGAKR
jgi:hypothetical protein